MEKQVIKVEGMSCSHCERAVEEAVMNLQGVKSAKAKSRKNLLTVRFDPSTTSIDAIKEAVVEEGYQA